MSIRIESRQNSRIKELLKLTKRRDRDERQITVVEGVREVLRALQSGIVPVEAYICLEHIQSDEAREARQRLEALDAARQCTLVEIPPDLYEKIAYRGESGGLILLIPYLPLSLDRLPLGPSPFLVLLENVEKPGNLGAILRTADAAGVDGVIVTHSAEYSPTDIHNPNAIRASLGTIFHVPLAQATTCSASSWLRENHIAIVTASPHSQTVYVQADFSGPTAIVMGSEAHGLSESWFQAADVQVTIPMHGVADSLNLSTSTAILLYEVVRQRIKK